MTILSYPLKHRDTAEPSPGETKLIERVRVVHAQVNGRARLQIDGLYHCEPVCRRVESALAREAGIRQVSANVLTGRVLVLYDPARTVDEIKGRVEELLANPSPPPSEQRPPSNLYPLRPVQPLVSMDGSAASAQGPAQWHTLSRTAVLKALETTKEGGLSQAFAEKKLRRFGPNSLPETPPRSGLSIFLGQFKSLPVVLLGASAVLSAATGGLADAVVILGVVMINAGTGYVTEAQAERTIKALGHIGQQHAGVIRDGQLVELEAEALVPGDIMVLVPGTRVAADGRVLESRSLMVDESALTGESLPVTKRVEALDKPEVPLGDRFNMVYKGTAITGGSGLAVVVGTGRYTEIGVIQALVGETRPPETPMQRQLDVLGNQMVLLAGGICGIMFLIGLARGYGWLQMLKTSISLAVAAVPEGLPTVATTTLALGIRNMRRRHVLVRHLDAVETLGAMQVICLDKTGTLTLNRMTVLAVHCGGRHITACQRCISRRRHEDGPSAK